MSRRNGSGPTLGRDLEAVVLEEAVWGACEGTLKRLRLAQASDRQVLGALRLINERMGLDRPRFGGHGLARQLAVHSVSAKKSGHRHRKTTTLGTATFSIAAGQTKKVTIHLSGQALKLLKKDKSMKATLTAITTDLFGTKTTTKSKVRLKPAKAKRHHKKK